MHDLSLSLFYETAFDVEVVGGETDALWSLVMSVRHWICGKWDRLGVRIPQDVSSWSRLKGATDSLADDGGVVRLESSRFVRDDGELLWGCKITEVIREGRRAPRQWCTEIGFSSRSQGSGRVSIVLSFGDRPGFLGEVQEEPSPTIPGIIQALLSNDHLRCTVSGKEAGIYPIGLHEGDFAPFWEFVSDPRRSVPVVYVSPRFPSGGEPSVAVDPRALARALGPSAVVYYSVDRGFCSEMRAGIGSRELRCENGLVRVYAEAPRFSEPGDGRRHRFFTLGEVEQMGEGRLVRLIRRALAQDVDFYESMTRVGTIQELARRRKIELAAKRRADERANETVEAFFEDTLTLEGDLQRAREERDQARAESHELSLKCDALEQALARRGAGRDEGVELASWPMSAPEIGALFRAAFPDVLDFTERGLRSLVECRCDAKVLWNALYDLCTIAHGLYAGDGTPDLKGEFDSRSRFEYAPCAGMMTRRDNRLMAGYRDVYQGRELNCEAHIKAGSKESDPGFIRVYFAYDRPTGRVVVSGCGGHRDNYSTRKIH